MSSATLATALSVRLMLSVGVVMLTAVLLEALVVGTRLSAHEVNVARIAIGEGGKGGDGGPTELVDEPLDQPPMQVADQLGIGLGQVAERAVGEGDGGQPTVVA